ncbi:MAG TPA: hypothetical protein VN728_15450 [Stellaceae bacterium]|jgi:hypothetical protein|nr:hypothetical protein [Stellaceae bacterium]
MAESASRRHRATAADWLGWVLRALDGVMRRGMGIEDLCAEPQCIIRIRVVPAERDICLADRTQIRKGDPVGELHLWNEHLASMADYESALAWALEIRRSFEFSFMCLAERADTDPRLRSVQAFRAGMSFANGIQLTAKLKHVMAWYGIQILPDKPKRFGRLRDFGNAIFTYALIRAFHPGGSFGRYRLQRRWHEFWLSRRVLCQRYGGMDATQLSDAGKMLAKRKDAA